MRGSGVAMQGRGIIADEGQMAAPEDTSTTARCGACVHHHVTWNPGLPWGCRHFGIKSRRLPCVEIEAASGIPCLGFQERDRLPAAIRPSR